MIKSEINEIKSLFDSIEDQGIHRLAGCYVNGEKQKVKTFSELFYNILEEEMHKYLEIFRKTLSGTPGKNLLDMSFVDQSGEEALAGKGLLKKMLRSGLEDDVALESFYDRVIETYNYVGNYLILLIFQSYDVPGITSDGIELNDASEEIYNYVLCSICPMKLRGRQQNAQMRSGKQSWKRLLQSAKRFRPIRQKHSMKHCSRPGSPILLSCRKAGARASALAAWISTCIHIIKKTLTAARSHQTV